MRIWFPLLLAPILVLADQSIAYATSGWACSHQDSIVLHVVHGVFLAACVIGAFTAFGLWREVRAAPSDERQHVRRFLSGVSIASASLAALVIAAMWMPTWFISSCFN